MASHKEMKAPFELYIFDREFSATELEFDSSFISATFAYFFVYFKDYLLFFLYSGLYSFFYVALEFIRWTRSSLEELLGMSTFLMVSIIL